MTRYADVPTDATRAQLAEYYDDAEQQRWPALLRANVWPYLGVNGNNVLCVRSHDVRGKPGWA